MFLHIAQSPQSCPKGSNRNHDCHTPSTSRHSYRGPANSKVVRSKDLNASMIPNGQYPMICHGEPWSAAELLQRRTNVASEHKVVENDTERILARIASGASLDLPAAALVDADICKGST